jgi:hypothetical protein
MHDKNIRAGRDERYKAEIPQGVERQLGIEIRHDGMRAGRDQQCITVGRRLGHQVCRNIAARAGAVIDDDLLIPQLTQFLADDAPEQIGAAAGRIANDNAHRLGRIILRTKTGGIKETNSASGE